MYLIRLDDASNYMDVEKWKKMETLLDRYNISPIVGIIPDNKDANLLKYEKDDKFWDKAMHWQEKKWAIAMHGYQHLYVTTNGGINPVQKRSEFAGLTLQEQKKKIKNGYNILKEKKLNPSIFFAPSHTFDINTLIALKEETPIRIINDTVANDVYYKNDFFFIPQQSGKVRNLPFKIVTFCYHPNLMTEEDFAKLEKFIVDNKNKIIRLEDICFKKHKKNIYDILLDKIYFARRR